MSFEATKVLIENEPGYDIDMVLENEIFTQPIVLNHENIETTIAISKYDVAYNLNDIFNADEKKQQNIEELFIENGVDYDAFVYFTKNYLKNIDINLKEFTNKKQILKVIDEYKKMANFNKIDDIKGSLSYMDSALTTKYILCALNLNINSTQYRSQFIYDLDNLKNENNIKVENFEISFK